MIDFYNPLFLNTCLEQPVKTLHCIKFCSSPYSRIVSSLIFHWVKFFVSVCVNYPVSLLSFTGLFKEPTSEPLLQSIPPLVHMMPVHQLSVAPGYSLSPALHTQPSAMMAGTISPLILRVPLQVPPEFSESSGD